MTFGGNIDVAKAGFTVIVAIRQPTIYTVTSSLVNVNPFDNVVTTLNPTTPYAAVVPRSTTVHG